MNKALKLLAMLSLLMGASSQAEDFLVSKEKLKFLANQVKAQKAEHVQNDIYKIKLNEEEVLQFSEVLHHKTKFCAGLMEIDSNTPAKVFMQELTAAKKLNELNDSFDNQPIRFQSQVKAFMGALDKNRFMGYISDLTQFPDRYSRSANGAKASKWIKDTALNWKNEFSRKDVSVFQVQTPSYKQPSVVIKIQGQDDTLKAAVIGGHMDTLRGNRPGADDDASGSASMLEIYRTILENNLKFNRSIYLSFYAAEEVGLIGSKYVVNHFTNQKIQVKAVMQLDMTGYDNGSSTNSVFFVRDYTNDSLTNFTKKLAQTYLNKGAKNIKDLKCGYACSDHARWYKKGVPAVFPFESTFKDYNPDIHTSRDGIQTVNPDHAFQFIQLASAFLLEMAEPTFKKLNVH